MSADIHAAIARAQAAFQGHAKKQNIVIGIIAIGVLLIGAETLGWIG